METRRHIRLFRNGANQAIRIPRGFELPGQEAVLSKEGHRLIIEPVEKPSLLAVLDSLETLDIDWPEVDEGLAAAEDVSL